MKIAVTFPFLMVLASCGGGSPSGTRSPEESARERELRAPPQKQADDQRDLIRAQDAERREAEAKKLNLPDAGDPKGGSVSPVSPESEALSREARAKAATARADELRKLCEPSQVTRANDAQSYAKTWTTWFARVSPHRAAIKASCKARDAAAVPHDTASPGDFDCQNLPKGVSKDDALKVLRFDSDWARANDPGYLTRETVVPKDARASSVNAQCAPYDLISDLDTQVTLGNTAGIEKLQKWKVKPPSPPK